jgi:hypothetical protein
MAWLHYSLLQRICYLCKILNNLSPFSRGSTFFAELDRLASETHYAEPILAVELGMMNVIKQLHASGMINHTQKPLLLWHAINRPCLRTILFSQVVTDDMTTLLLLFECDPNITFTTSSGILTTPWKSWLQYLKTRAIERPVSMIADITEVFINAGGDVNVQGAELGGSLEALIENCLTRSATDTNPFDLPPSTAYQRVPLTESPSPFVLTREQRAMKVRCNEILQLIAQKRSLVNTQVQGQPTDQDKPPSRVAALQLSDSGTTTSAATLQKRKKRLLVSESQLFGKTAHSGGPSRDVKRRRRGL